MGLYWQIARRGFRRYATYRAATAAGIFTNTVFGFIRAYVFITLLRTAGDIGGYTLRDTLTYTFVTQGRMRGDLAAAMLHDPESSFWTSRPSAWMWWPRNGFGASSRSSTRREVSRSSSRPTTCQTSSGCAAGSS
jgi:hypothetical protein